MATDPRPPALVPAVWTAIGPSVMRNGQAFTRPPVSGRVPSIALSRYADVVYAATSNGGVWRSDDAGLSWRPLMDPLDSDPLNVNGRADSLACGAVAIHPDHPERVFVGTGEAFGAIDSFLGVGPLVSEDGGRHWVTEAVSGTDPLVGEGFYAIAVDPAEPGRAVGATRVGLYRREPVAGVPTWVQKALGVPGSPTRDASSVVAVRDHFFAALRPGGAGQPAVVLRSTDQGHSWAPVGTGFPADAGRVTLAVHPERSDVVYAVRQNGQLWRLRLNAAGTGAWRRVAWTPQPAGIGAFVGSQGWYDLALAVDPADVDTVYCGGSTVPVNTAGEVVASATASTVWSSSIWRVRVRAQGANLVARPTYIGHTIHADVHALVFPRGLPGQLWVGCDGGVFATDSAQAPRPAFRSLNSGLATTLINALAQHPSEPAVLFAATQDNGGQRLLGDEASSLTTEGDAGSCVVDWSNPYRVLMTYTHRTVLRCTDGGAAPASWADVSVPGASGDTLDAHSEFYAPIAGTPPSATPAEANRVAYGSRRLWLSETFGGNWRSLPSNAAGDNLPNNIASIRFASFGIVYVGTVGGGVFRYTQAANPGPWVRTRLDNAGPAPGLGLWAPVTDVVPDPADPSGMSLYAVLGGSGDHRHVWHWDNTAWTARSGPGGANSLLDVQANALEVDPGDPTQLYLATDVGLWRSTDRGATWAPWGVGLPEAAVTDLLIFPPVPSLTNPPGAAAPALRLLRAATHGRSAFVRRLGAPGAPPPARMAPVQLLLRDHRLDLGLLPSVYGQNDPGASGALLAPGHSPDIRCDAPDAAGAYRFPEGHRLSLIDFFELSDDDSTRVPTAAQPVATRVQVLVHNQGPHWVHGVQVSVLIAAGRHGSLPDLPPGWAARLRAGQAVNGGSGSGWQTVGHTTVSDLWPGHPQVATLTLSSALLPAPDVLAATAGSEAWTLLVALHHADDPLVTDLVDAEAVADGLRQVALRHLTVVALAPAAAAGPRLPPRFVPIGPSPMLNGLAQGGPPVAGRTPGLAIARHGEIAYAGSANGGVWRSDDGGASWQSCMEAFDLDPAALRTDSLACPAVAIHPDHPERVFVGTGEPFGNGDAYFGIGLLVSLDGGRNWLREPTVAGPKPVAPAVLPPAQPLTASGLLMQRGCWALAVDPADPQRAFAATNVGLFLREPDRVGGWHWRRLWFALTVDGAGQATSASEIPDVTGLACAAAGGVTTVVAALRGGRVFRFRSDDPEAAAGAPPLLRPLGAASWPASVAPAWLPSQLPAPPALAPAAVTLRCSLAMREDDPDVVYLVRQDGSGFRWDAVSDRWGRITPMPVDPTPASATPGQGTLAWVGTQGWYDLAVAVDPRDVNRIVLGGSTVQAMGDAVVAVGTPGANWFSSIWVGSLVANGADWTLASRYIGARAHADVHRLAFTPGDGSQLWAGTDGGVFRCEAWEQPGAAFRACNRGLQTLQGNGVDTHPTEDALLLLSTQDNGAALGQGTPGWRMVFQGDAGAAVWHWGDVLAGLAPRVLVGYMRERVYRLQSGGSVMPPHPQDKVFAALGGDAIAFYPPLVGAPPNPAQPAQANRVLLGGQRLWLSDTFGGPAPSTGSGDWASLPSNGAADRLPGGQLISAIAFLSFDRIVVGTDQGHCYLYERPAPAAAWSGPQSLASGSVWPRVAATAPPAVPGEPAPLAPPPPRVTGICRDPADAAARSFYVCLGGSVGGGGAAAGTRRVWRAQVTLNGAGNVTGVTWSARSGNGATGLLDVQHNAIVADAGGLYVGADIGLWRSTDGGAHWRPFSEGLPDAPVVDLELAPNGLLRVSTHGRGCYERQVPPVPVPRVRLLLRETVLDRGLRPAAYGARDAAGAAVAPAASPDIVVDAPLGGAYQTPPQQGLDAVGFAALADRSATVATHLAGVVNRVYVQLQNTGVEACRGATVHLLLAEAVGGQPPALPADHAAALRSGLPVHGGGWRTLGLRRLGRLDAREPRVAAFDLHSDLLPRPAELPARASWYLLALAHHELDPFPDPAVAVQPLVDAQRHAALRAITVTALAGDPPAVQGPPREIPAALPLATAIVAQRRLAALARHSRIRMHSGDHLTDVDRGLHALLQAAATALPGPDPLSHAAAAEGLSRFVMLGAIGLDLPDWADWLEARPGWMRSALRRGSADEAVSATLADALTVVGRTAQFALAGTADATGQARIRAFCAGMACAVAGELLIGPLLRGAAALRGPADPGPSGGVDRAIAETWVSRTMLAGQAEQPAFDGWFPSADALPPALLPAFARALQESLGPELAARRLSTTEAPAEDRPPDADALAEGLQLWQASRAPSNWGLGTWFAVLLPVFLAPALGVMLARFGDHGGRLLRQVDESKGPDDPANASDEKSWYQVANITLACGIPAPLAYGLALWAIVPRRDADFVQFTVAGGLRTVFAVTSALTLSASPGIRWGLLFTPWVATDLYFLVRSIVHYAGRRPGSGLMHLIQALPLMGLAVAWLFCLLIRGADLRRDAAFWPLWGLFTGLLLGGGLLAAWRLAAGGGLRQLLRDRVDVLPGLGAWAGQDLLGLPRVRAQVWPEHLLESQGAGLAGQRYPAGMRPLLQLWHAAEGWEIRPWADRVELRQGGGAVTTVALPQAQTAAELLASLQAAVPGLQGQVVEPASAALPWPLRLATHGDDQPSWALHDLLAQRWRALPRAQGDAYPLRQAPRSRRAGALGAPTGRFSPAEDALDVLPGRDAVDPLGADLGGTALGRAGDLAALFQLALAPLLNPGLTAALSAGPTPLQAGREVLRRWNLDERREAEWRWLVGLDAVPDQAPERLAPGPAAPAAGEEVARIGLLPTLDAWGQVLRDDRIDLDADRSSPAMPLLRPRGQAPRPLTHRELRDALRTLMNLP